MAVQLCVAHDTTLPRPGPQKETQPTENSAALYIEVGSIQDEQEYPECESPQKSLGAAFVNVRRSDPVVRLARAANAQDVGQLRWVADHVPA